MTGELTLKSPLTKEDWDKIADVELERTKRIWFKTPSGKSVEFIPMSVIDAIKSEIEEVGYAKDEYGNIRSDVLRVWQVLNIIEKHTRGGDAE